MNNKFKLHIILPSKATTKRQAVLGLCRLRGKKIKKKKTFLTQLRACYINTDLCLVSSLNVIMYAFSSIIKNPCLHDILS